MNWQFTLGDFDSLAEEWAYIQQKTPTGHIFSSPEWSKAWWQHFSSDCKLYLGSIKKQGQIIGIVPLTTRGNTASFIGSIDVCDYLDFIVQPGEEEHFFQILLENLVKAGITELDLAPLRPDSTVIKSLANIVEHQGLQASINKEDVSVDLLLPATWESYLKLLNSKQRHELKRKFRRLEEMGNINFRTSIDANPNDIALFLKLFQESREDKALFLTPKMEGFFRSIFSAMAQEKVLRLNILELSTKPIAATICLDFKDIVYLYNSGYDSDFRWLSAGLISKAMCIQDSILRNKKCFDFLKGNEEYKYQLGGQKLPIYRYSAKLIK
jgi:CelD/BcsL family acetyltransferase involved in cellulose biosynthesis